MTDGYKLPDWLNEGERQAIAKWINTAPMMQTMYRMPRAVSAFSADKYNGYIEVALDHNGRAEVWHRPDRIWL